MRVELGTLVSNAASRAIAERYVFVLDGIHRNAARAADGTLHDRCAYAAVPGAA